MKLIIDIPDSDYTAVRCEALYYIGHDKLAESVTTAFQTAIPYEEPTGDLISRSELRKVVSEKLIDLSTLQQQFPNKSLVDAIAYNVGIKDCLQEINNTTTAVFQ